MEQKTMDDDIFEVSPIPMWVYDPSTLRFLAVNMEAVVQYGYTKEEFMEMTIAEIFPSSGAAMMHTREKKQGPEAGDRTVRVDLHLEKGGRLRKVKAKGSKIRFKGKDAELVIAVDITHHEGLGERVTGQREGLEFLEGINRQLIKASCADEAVTSVFSMLWEPWGLEKGYFLEVSDEAVGTGPTWTVKTYDFPTRALSPGLGTAPFKLEHCVGPGAYGPGHPYRKELDQVLPEVTMDGLMMVVPILSEGNRSGYLVLLGKRHPYGKLLDLLLSNIGSSLSGLVEKFRSLGVWHLHERKFKALVERSSELIAILNSEGRIDYFSPSCANLLGQNPGEFIGTFFLEHVHKSHREMVSEKLKKVRKKGRVKLKAFRAFEQEDRPRWLEMNLSDMHGVAGVGGTVLNMVEITELKVEQENAKMINERYRLAALASKDHIYDMDMKTGMVTRMGRALESLFGDDDPYRTQYPYGFWKDRIHPADREKVLWLVDGFISSPYKENLSLSYRFRRADGSYAHVLDFCSAIRDQKGKVLRIVGSLRDISRAIHHEEMKDLMFRVSYAMGQPGKLDASMKRGLVELLIHTGGELGEVWLRSKDGSRLYLNTTARRKSRTQPFNAKKGTLNQVRKGEGLPGHVWKFSSVQIWEGLANNPLFLRSGDAREAGLDSGMGIPIVHGTEVIGVFLVFTSGTAHAFHHHEKYLQEIGLQVGATVKNKLMEAELLQFMGISSNLLAIVDPDGKVIRCNAAFARVLGKERRDVVGKGLDSFAVGEDSERLLSFLDPLDRSDFLVVAMKNRAGDQKWVAWKKNFSKGEQVFYCMGQDISESKKAQYKLKNAYRRLDSAQRIAKLGYWSRNWDETNSEWSEQTYRIFGVDPREFEPTYEKVLERFHPHDRHLMENVPLDRLKNSGPVKFVHRILKGCGTTRWVAQTVNLVLDDEGNPTMIEGVVQDITEQRESEDKIKLNNERFSLAMKATREMIWDIDHESGSILRSGALTHLVAYREKERFSINNSWLTNVVAGDAVWKSYMLVCGNRDKHYWQMEYRVRNKKGELLYVKDRCYIIRDKEGRPTRAVGAIEDVSETRKHMDIIAEQNRKLREIAWKQSHLVRAPLSNIMLLTSLLQAGCPVDREILSNLSIAAGNLDAIVHQINQEVQAVEKYLSETFYKN